MKNVEDSLISEKKCASRSSFSRICITSHGSENIKCLNSASHLHMLHTVSMFRVLCIRNFQFPTCLLPFLFSSVLLFVHLFLSTKHCSFNYLLCVSTFCIDASLHSCFKLLNCFHANAPAALTQQRRSRRQREAAECFM